MMRHFETKHVFLFSISVANTCRLDTQHHLGCCWVRNNVLYGPWCAHHAGSLSLLCVLNPTCRKFYGFCVALSVHFDSCRPIPSLSVFCWTKCAVCQLYMFAPPFSFSLSPSLCGFTLARLFLVLTLFVQKRTRRSASNSTNSIAVTNEAPMHIPIAPPMSDINFEIWKSKKTIQLLNSCQNNWVYPLVALSISAGWKIVTQSQAF